MLGVVGLLGFIILMGSFFIVSPGSVAIKTRMGTLVGSYGEGTHMKLPLIESIDKFSMQIERTDIKCEAFSKDLQTMTAHLAVNHRIQQETITSIYRNLGPNYVNTILDPTVQEVLKSITAKYSAEAVISNRMQVVKELNDEAKARMKEKEIIVTDISIVDLSFQKAFMDAVEAKQVAEQQSLQAQKLVEKAKMEAERSIATARAQAEGLRMQKEQVTDKMIELRKVEVQLELAKRWSGKLPDTVVGGAGAIPLLNLNNMGK